MGNVIPFPKKVVQDKSEKSNLSIYNINKSFISYLRLDLEDYLGSLPNQPDVLVGIKELFDEVLVDMKRRESR